MTPLEHSHNVGISLNEVPVRKKCEGSGSVGLLTRAVGLLGDVNSGGKVSILDIFKRAVAFGMEEGDPDWNPNVDSNQDEIINILDILLAPVRFGESV